jgi:hypothetical protein
MMNFSPARRAELIEWAASQSRDPADPVTQQDFLYHLLGMEVTFNALLRAVEMECRYQYYCADAGTVTRAAFARRVAARDRAAR